MEVDAVVLGALGVLLQDAVDALDAAKAENMEDVRNALLRNVGKHTGNKQRERLVDGRHFAFGCGFLRNDLLHSSFQKSISIFF